MNILGIETSCDETSVGIVRGGEVEGLPTPSNGAGSARALAYPEFIEWAGRRTETGPRTLELLSNVVSSSLPLHAKSGGIIPEIAAREQVKLIIPVINQAIKQSNNEIMDIDAIAVTYGPGLMGSLLVGIETAKALSFVWNKPLIPVNHLLGHIYANWIDKNETPQFPALALVVSGGHTDLVLIKDHGNLKWLGGTRDDAAGEAFDKIGRLLGLPYPGGPAIEKAAERGDLSRFTFPRPMIDSSDFDFSFSGLKTAVFREVQTMKQLNNETINDISASVQQAIVDVLIKKTLDAAKKYRVKSILLGGGVAANQKLRDQMKFEISKACFFAESKQIGNLKLEIGLFVPPAQLCTDNGAMIAATAFFNFKPQKWQKLSANPELYFD